jgi:hypothetical protein
MTPNSTPKLTPNSTLKKTPDSIPMFYNMPKIVMQWLLFLSIAEIFPRNQFWLGDVKALVIDNDKVT